MTTTTESPARPANVIEALAAVRRELGGIGKNQEMNDGGQRWKYRGIEDVTARLGPLLGEYGVVFVPRLHTAEPEPLTSKTGTSGVEWRCLISYTVYGPGGVDDRIEAGPVYALARDWGDKGIQKTMTSAYKQILVQVFCIGDSKDDIDESNPEGQLGAPREEEPPDEATQARRDLASRIRRLADAERAAVKTFVEQREIPNVTLRMTDEQLAQVAEFVDMLEMGTGFAGESGDSAATDEPAEPAAADETVEAAQEATGATPDDLALAAPALLEAVIAEVQGMRAPEVDEALKQRELPTGGNVDTRKHRLVKAFIGERQSEERAAAAQASLEAAQAVARGDDQAEPAQEGGEPGGEERVEQPALTAP